MLEIWRMPQLPSLVMAPVVASVLWMELVRLNCSLLVYWMNSGLTGNVIGAAIAVVPVSTATANTARKAVKRVEKRISILLISSHYRNQDDCFSRTPYMRSHRDLISSNTSPT